MLCTLQYHIIQNRKKASPRGANVVWEALPS